ncbi:MAG: DUF3060 domain-containing protein [Mycobacterium sp.]|nr:DUF3060 domain-containing protein [Mycobacterium sp.]
MTSEDEDPEARIAGLERSLSASAAHVETPPTAIRSGLRLGWVLLAVLVTGLVISGGVMLVDHRTRTVAGWPTGEQTPEVVAPAPEIPTAPAPSRPAPPTGEPITVSGVGGDRTVACTDGDVMISGVDNTVVLTGRCARVEVSGIENRVSIEEAAEIVVSGLNNEVRFRSGTPELNKSGLGNTVERG